MSVMQAVKLLFKLHGYWKFEVGHDPNTESSYLTLALNEGGAGICFNLNLGRNSSPHRSQFIYLYAFGWRWYKQLDKKNVG